MESVNLSNTAQKLRVEMAFEQVELNERRNKNEQLQQQLDVERLCKLCKENSRDTLFKTCGHIVYCYVCANGIYSKTSTAAKICPICHEKIKGLLACKLWDNCEIESWIHYFVITLCNCIFSD